MKNKWVLYLSIIIVAFFGLMIPVRAEGNVVSDYERNSTEYISDSEVVTGKEITMFIFGSVIFLGVIGFMVYLAIIKTREKREYEITEAELQQVLPDYTLDKLKEELYHQYICVQNAYSGYQYDQLDQYCHPFLSKEYKTQLSYLHDKHGTNIMNDFELLDMKIQEVSKDNGDITIKVYLKNKYIDYTVDDKNNLLRGDYQNKILVENRLVFYKKKEMKRAMKFCPKCGTDLNGSQECPACGHQANKKTKFVLKEKGAFV